MADVPTLLGPDGQPIKRAVPVAVANPQVLTQEIARASLASVRSPMSGYPGDGLNPRRLAMLMKEADRGQPLRFFELAEQIEERDLHYAGVLATRKRSVAQLEIQVDAASDDTEHKAHADLIRAWVGRDELQFEIFDMLDAIGKGISFTEIMWDNSEGQWSVDRLEWRDPRFFRFDYEDGRTPLLRDNGGDLPLPAFKFIVATIKAKSGLPVRSGIARLAAWSWMFKAFTQRDWAIFTQTYGQPVRVGKYPIGASEGDKDTLYTAVANIAGDCAAIIPDSMLIEFVEAANIANGTALFKERCDWLDQQVSKAILGQTATTDAIAGGHAVGREHRAVQEDIERADAKALSAIINRDLVKPWIDLEFGEQDAYPRLRIGRAEVQDIELIVDSVDKLVPMGLQVEKSFFNDLLGIPKPAAGAELLTAPPPGDVGGGLSFPPALQSRRPPRSADDIAQLAAAAEALGRPAGQELIGQIREVVLHAQSLPDLKTKLAALKLKPDKFAKALQIALVMAHLSGREAVANEV